MHARTTPLREAALSSPVRIFCAGAGLTLALAVGCEPTQVPAIELARQAQEEQVGDGPVQPAQEEGEGDAQDPECFLAILYTVEGDLLHRQGGSEHRTPSGGGGGVGGGGGGLNGVGMYVDLYGYDGFARLLWGGDVVAEFAIDKAFLQSDRVEVLAYETPEGVRYEYHLYTPSDCDRDWGPEGRLTRQQVEALEK